MSDGRLTARLTADVTDFQRGVEQGAALAAELRDAMTDPIEKLNAAIDEDERIAIAAADSLACGCHPGAGTQRWIHQTHSDYVHIDDPTGHEVFAGAGYGGTQLDDEIGDHIARFDPDRALRQVAKNRKMLAWHPVTTRAENGFTEYTCPCLWDPHMEVSSWHPTVICELIAIMAGEYQIEVLPCTCRDCTPKSQWAERGYA